MSNKDKGSRREREVRDYLLDGDCLVVKSGGSLGAFDLIGIEGPDGRYLRLVQVKSNHWPGPAEREEMSRLMGRMPKVLMPVAEIARCDDRRGWKVLRLTEGGWNLVLPTGGLAEEVFER